MRRIVAACPSFAVDEDDADLAWVTAGCLGQHLIALLDEGRVIEVEQTLAAVESVVEESGPDSGAINLITTGLMEGVDPRREDFAHLLGPQSRRWWRGLNAYLAAQQSRLEPIDE